MPCPRFFGCIARNIVDKLSWPQGARWDDLSRAQKGELTKDQVQSMIPRLTHKPLLYEHPQKHNKVKIGEIVHNYISDDGAWKVVFEINDGTQAGRTMLKEVRDGRLKGLSLSHDTVDLKPIEVSLVEEGFRYETGIEGEMSHDIEYESKEESYISQPQVMQASLLIAGVPRIINAGVVMMSLPNQYQQQTQQQPAPTQQQPAPTQQQQQQPQEQQQVDPISSDSLKQYGDRLLRSNIDVKEKQNIMTMLTAMAKEKSDLLKRQADLEANLQTFTNDRNKTSGLFAQVFETMLNKHAPRPANETDADSQKLVTEDPHKWMAANLPRVMAASARMMSQQPQEQIIPSPIPSYDPQLWAQYQSFQQVVGNNFGQGDYQPRTLQASNNQTKRQRQDSGLGGWIQNDRSLIPGTAAIWNETQAAAMAGFGDSTRLGDALFQTSKRQSAPSESELAMLQQRN
jgi:hypothetical protein